MKHAITIIRNFRSQALQLFDTYSEEQLNQVPEGFNNNILWNLGHLIASDQQIWYMASNHPLRIDKPFIDTFRRGTKPEQPYDAATIQQVKNFMIQPIDDFVADYNTGMFSEYNTWTPLVGGPVTSLDEAIAFSAFHHGLHASAINRIRKFIG
ncbi:DinB family protein [Chitinophaga dinghuensis]|uniref:DinB family protein n=1 Tax=Chitinophaga dinghuensis TaxID=1539050 RepID=A0A327VUA9_9BACT|nr:DinB family protein [Chitinophaga dinghuensis]RAJ77538.1 DinB family protein [Chitinophaga dinghuensis]